MGQPILSKKDFVRRYERGEFGNHSPTWKTVEKFVKCYEKEWPPNEKRYHVRSRKPGGDTHYNKSYKDVVRFNETHTGGSYYVSEMAPTHYTSLQGEVRLTVLGMELHYSTVKKPMREALLEKSETITGLKAKACVQVHMNAVSYDWLNYLFEEYPAHIIEFSCYSINWGTLPGYNTVFWEVRPDRLFGRDLSPHTEVY